MAWASAYGQNVTGEIDGTVTDSTGAVVPKAAVAVTNIDMNTVVRTTVTDGGGRYTAPQLIPGNYSVTVTAPGFRATTETGIALTVGDTLTINAALAPAAGTTEVTVTEYTQAPQLETAESSSIIDNTQMKELALSTRNFEQMVMLQPGVSNGDADTVYPGRVAINGTKNSSNMSINGLRTTQMTWLMDGADMLDRESSTQATTFPSVDAISEVKVLRGSYGAQYGGGGSAQVMVVTKSGGKAFHGDAYYFFRNQDLNANEFFNKIANPVVPRPAVDYKNFGFTIGGPVFIPKVYPRSKSKTFFFYSQEFRRLVNYPLDGGGSVTNYPQMAQANGYFQSPVCYVWTYTSGSSTCQTRAALVTNSPYAAQGYNFQIPQASFDPVALAYLKDQVLPALAIQQPNSPTDPQGLILQQKSTWNGTQELFRLDHQFSQRVSAFFRFVNDPLTLLAPNGFNIGSGYPGVGVSNIYTFGRAYLGHATWVVTPRMVLDAGFSYEPYGTTVTPTGTATASNSPDIHVQTPFPVTIDRVPNLSLNSSSWQTRGPQVNLDRTFQPFVNLTFAAGKHTLYFGGNFEHYAMTLNQGNANAGTFGFSASNSTQTVGGVPYAVLSFEQTWAKFLVGSVNNFSQSSVDATATPAANLAEFYLQDNWKVLPRLTLNIGVRYSIYGQYYDRLGHLGVFQPEAYNPQHAPAIDSNGALCLQAGCSGGAVPNPLYDPLNGIVTGGVNSPYGRAVSSTPLLDFAPRFGFAWDMFGTGKSALRGGYGIYYNQAPATGEENDIFGNPLYVRQATFNSTTSPMVMSNPGAGTSVSNTVLAISGQERNWHTPYTQSWSLDLQQQLTPSTMVTLGYVGNLSIHLTGEDDLNQPLPGAYAAAGINGGKYPTAGAPTQQLNQIRPYLGYSAIAYIDNRFMADYNALQTSFRKRFAKHAMLNVNYTWSKSLTNSPNNGGDMGSWSAPQNSYDLSGEYGPSPLDRRHILTVSTVYPFPFFKSQRGIKGKVLGGWEFSGIVQAVSGTWLTATQNNVDPAGQGHFAGGQITQQRTDMSGDPNAGAPHTISEWFNTSVFSYVPAGLYRPGNEPVETILGPGYQVWNTTLHKNVTLPNERRLQFRFEAFNALNHVNFSGVSVKLNNPNFGQVTGARNMRQIQIGVKFYY